MTPERFADWLQGFVEIQDSETITDKQWLIIKDHLKLVFEKKTPDRNFKNLTTVDFPPSDYRILDLIGKQHTWNGSNPPAITC